MICDFFDCNILCSEDCDIVDCNILDSNIV